MPPNALPQANSSIDRLNMAITDLTTAMTAQSSQISTVHHERDGVCVKERRRRLLQMCALPSPRPARPARASRPWRTASRSGSPSTSTRSMFSRWYSILEKARYSLLQPATASSSHCCLLDPSKHPAKSSGQPNTTTGGLLLHILSGYLPKTTSSHLPTSQIRPPSAAALCNFVLDC